jgi:hypothetical protein
LGELVSLSGSPFPIANRCRRFFEAVNSKFVVRCRIEAKVSIG